MGPFPPHATSSRKTDQFGVECRLEGVQHCFSRTMNTQDKTVAEFFAGIGLMRIGLETVPGFLSSNDGRDFENALLALNDLGYAVDAFIIDAARFVPQSRQRLFVIGLKTREVAAFNETPGFYESESRPAALASFIWL